MASRDDNAHDDAHQTPPFLTAYHRARHALGEILERTTRPRGLDALRAWLGRLVGRRPGGPAGRVAELAASLEALERYLWDAYGGWQRLEEKLEGVVVEASRRSDDLRREQEELRQQAAELGRTFTGLQSKITVLEDELNPVPYMAEPDLLTIGGDGDRRPGFEDRRDDLRDDPYHAFEELFRGPEELIRARQRRYLDKVVFRPPVVDAGCGRGEMLDLLSEAGVPAAGIDINPALVRHCRDKGHRAEIADVVEHLERQEDDSIGTIFSAQVLEHLEYTRLTRFLEEGRRVLKPGGALICETVNPHSFRAFKTFWVDPTHRSPLFPEVLVALFRLYGFARAEAWLPNGTGGWEEERLRQGEYAVIAHKQGSGLEDRRR